MYAEEAFKKVLELDGINSVLDIGSGTGDHSILFSQNEKKTTSIDLGNISTSRYPFTRISFSDFTTNDKFDLVWACHVLEHQLNVNDFLKKAYSLVSDNGYLCVTVPPYKKNIVGGHFSLWNMGLLIYNLIMAGVNCKNAKCKTYGYNVSVIVKKEKVVEISKMDLFFDKGDIEKLSNFFPFKSVSQGFNGEISEVNWQ
jgi:ubiquinone/menaquinone biosynthesis C-methylase UbiE